MTLSAREDLLAAADSVLDLVGRGAAEVVITERQHALTRFARNQIHQNVTETSREVRLRLIADDRVGVAAQRGDMEDAAQRLVTAAEAARRLAPAGDVTPLPKPDAGPDLPVAHSPATVACTPEWRADQACAIAEASRGAGFEAFGVVETAATATAVVSTAGTRRHAVSTAASVICLCRGEDGWGYADRHHADCTRLEATAVAREASEICARNQGALPIAPGTYPVVLSSHAVADLLAHLSDLGFSAQAAEERRSFMRPGERLVSESITVVDDAADPAAMPFPFDGEGVSTRAVVCIEEGVCRSLLHDSATALREGVPSTGHALPMPNPVGPWARHLVMTPGAMSEEDLIAACGTGLYVNRLWYVRDVHPLRTVITGMTRDGTFRIEQGRLGAPVRDLRFTQSIVDALADVRGVGRDRHLERDEGERALLVPALCLGHFAFTS